MPVPETPKTTANRVGDDKVDAEWWVTPLREVIGNLTAARRRARRAAGRHRAGPPPPGRQWGAAVSLRFYFVAVESCVKVTPPHWSLRTA